MTRRTHVTLNIRLGNSEMQTSSDVAEALRKAADQIDEHADTLIGWGGMSRGIFDVNGNPVGSWRVRELDTPEREAKEIVKGAFSFIDGERFRDADVEEQSATHIASVIADTLREEWGVTR